MPSMLNQWLVREYADLVRDKDGVVLLELDALTVDESQAIRRAVREQGAELRVTKNRLARVAFEEAGVPLGIEAFHGTCALLVGDTEAAIGAAKAIEEILKKMPERKIRYRAAWFDGDVMDEAAASNIPKMPDRQTLRAMMAQALAGPARKLATVLNEVGASTARALQARADQGGESSGEAA